MYVGLILLLAGIAAVLASDWLVILLVPTVLVLHFGVVLREERYLEAKFGEDYRRYKASVPRYGWLR
jgi:protein-S-isoprenylcysteine O-methyltransferase Ste14